MKIAIIFIGTSKYINFLEDYYYTINETMLIGQEKHFFVFTDQTNNDFLLKDDISMYPVEHRGWPHITLSRFKFISRAKEELKDYDWLLYVDSDMKVHSRVTYDDLFKHDRDFIGVRHPGYLNTQGTFETNRKSTAFVHPSDNKSTYWQGCIWGGKVPKVFELITKLDKNIDRDLEKGIIAMWHDESHLNKFFIDNKDNVYTLHSGYAYPENWKLDFDKKIIHLDKSMEQYPRFEGKGI